MIRHTIFAVGTNEAKLILTGCLLEAGGKEITMVAVDGFRLALKKTVSENDVIEGTTEEKVSVVIPSKTLNELTKIIEETDDDVKIICSEKNVRFEFNNVNLVSRLLEGDYIDYKKIIPSEFKTSVKTDVRSILNAVERVSLIITSEVNKAPIVMSIKTGEIEMNCETQAGNVEEIIPVETKGEGFEIGFNNKYLLDALRAATSENIVIDLIGSVNPCLITPEEGDDFKFIVLPVRI